MFEQKHPAGSKLMSPLGISEQLILSSCKGNKDFPCDSDNKESACNVGDLGLIPGLERSPGGGHGNPLQYPCLANPRGQRSLAGYSPGGHKELDTAERLSTAQHTGDKQQRQRRKRRDTSLPGPVLI